MTILISLFCLLFLIDALFILAALKAGKQFGSQETSGTVDPSAVATSLVRLAPSQLEQCGVEGHAAGDFAGRGPKNTRTEPITRDAKPPSSAAITPFLLQKYSNARRLTRVHSVRPKGPLVCALDFLSNFFPRSPVGEEPGAGMAATVSGRHGPEAGEPVNARTSPKGHTQKPVQSDSRERPALFSQREDVRGVSRKCSHSDQQSPLCLHAKSLWRALGFVSNQLGFGRVA